jgi:hypothetical protein
LDGLPLALELAASRLRSLDSRALLQRLEKRLPVLTGGRRDAPERQRTLRATIEWSYDLLSPALQGVFARIGVFAGTFSLEAVEAVARASLDDLDALVEASLSLRALDELNDRRTLLLIDNFEHVLDAAPEIASMLAATANTKVLVTSRTPLRIAGEREYPVEPLPVNDAVALLTERARAVRPDFTERARDRAFDEVCSSDARQRHEEDSALKIVDELGRNLQSEPRLAAPAGSCQGDRPYTVAQQRLHLFELASSAHQGARGDRKVRRVEGLERRELPVAELIDALLRCQVLEPMVAEIAQSVAPHEIPGRLRDENLAAVSRGRDPGSTVHVHADVALGRHDRLTRVQAHPHTNRSAGKRVTATRSGRKCLRRLGKGEEERIALGVDLDAAVTHECVSQRAPVIRQDIGVTSAELP